LLGEGGTWDRLREKLAPMVLPPKALRDCLTAAGAARSAEGIGCSRQRLLAAFAHAHQIRPRFTVLDLARLLGLMPACAEEIVQAWA
jgi:glycerol dehydrogenase-like iron-containing ADH family enzyme